MGHFFIASLQRTPPVNRRPRSSQSDHTVSSSGDASPIRKPRPHSIAGRVPGYAAHTVSSQARLGRSTEKKLTGNLPPLCTRPLSFLCSLFSSPCLFSHSVTSLSYYPVLQLLLLFSCSKMIAVLRRRSVSLIIDQVSTQSFQKMAKNSDRGKEKETLESNKKKSCHPQITQHLEKNKQTCIHRYTLLTVHQRSGVSGPMFLILTTKMCSVYLCVSCYM